MEAAFRDIGGASWPDLLNHRIALLVLDHLLAIARNNEDDFLGTRMIVARVAPAGRQVDDAAGKACRPIHFGSYCQRQPAPVETEGADVLRIHEHLALVGHRLSPSFCRSYFCAPPSVTA